MQGFLGVPLTSADRIKERRKVIQANSRSKQPQEFRSVAQTVQRVRVAEGNIMIMVERELIITA